MDTVNAEAMGYFDGETGKDYDNPFDKETFPDFWKAYKDGYDEGFRDSECE